MDFPRSNSRGFTLIELMLAISLMLLLIGGVFSVQRGALIISRNVIEAQEASMRQNAFVELMRRNLEQMPGNSRINLILPRSGGGASELYLKDYPLAFAWSGVSAGSKGVIMRVEKNRVGNFTAVVLYMNEESAKQYEEGTLDERATDRVTGLPLVRRLELMEGIRTLTWSFYDDSVQDWVFEWPFENTRRPSLVKMELEMADGSEPLRLVFWIPVMANPQQFAGVGGNTGNPQPGGGNPGGGPPGGIPPVSITPGGPGGGPPPGAGPPGGGRGGRGDGGGGRGGRGSFGGNRGGGGFGNLNSGGRGFDGGGGRGFGGGGGRGR